MKNPLIVALTGLDGSGKSTLCRELKVALGAQRTHVVSLWDSMSHWEDPKKVIAYFDTLRGAARTHFIFQAYHHSLDMTLRGLKERRDTSDHQSEQQVILLDGYWYKYAATEIAYGMDFDWILNLSQCFPAPDCVLCLNVSPELALSRKSSPSRYEQGLAGNSESPIGFVNFQKSVVTSWRDVRQAVETTDKRWRDLDSSKDVKVLVREALDEIEGQRQVSLMGSVRPGLTTSSETSGGGHRISISGIDGTGKTTLIRALTQRYQNSPEEVFPIRSPQFHEDSRLPLAGLSESFDRLGTYADQSGNPLLKAASLFFSMSLYGSIERTVHAIYRPKILFVERQCVLDTLAYGEFYLPQLSAAAAGASTEGKEKPLEQIVLEILGPEKAQDVQSWFRTLAQRDSQFVVEWNSLLKAIAYVFSGQPQEVVSRLLKIYNAELPDQIILLTLSPEALQARSQLKNQPLELHEQSETLARLAQAQKRAAFLLKSIKPSLEIVELCTENQSVAESLKALLSKVNRIQNHLQIAVG